jgi:SAM-dependent methyltransferase
MGFEWAYRSGTPPWDIGRAQPAIVRLAEARIIAGEVVDVGCGTGENALYLASRGLAVVGVDAAPTAIAQAREKARARQSSAAFLVADAFALEGLGARSTPRSTADSSTRSATATVPASHKAFTRRFDRARDTSSSPSASTSPGRWAPAG